jgi:hypothetical protein
MDGALPVGGAGVRKGFLEEGTFQSELDGGNTDIKEENPR